MKASVRSFEIDALLFFVVGYRIKVVLSVAAKSATQQGRGKSLQPDKKIHSCLFIVYKT
jgi:hypothetical protein